MPIAYRKNLKRAMHILLFILAGIAGLLLLIRVNENRMVFFPSRYPGGNWHPEWYNLPVEDCFFSAPDGTRLHGWFVANSGAAATIIWCHGNAGNISDRLENLALLAKLPINIFIFDYRGYGRSAGQPDEAGVYLDALTAYDYLLTKPGVDANKIIIFGRSLGGAVAVDLASRRPAAALILESTFPSARSMASRVFPFLPVQLVMKSRFDSAAKIADIEIPKLILHGTQDEVVPYELGRQLFEIAPEPKEFQELPGAHHNDTYLAAPDYFVILDRFIRSVAQATTD